MPQIFPTQVHWRSGQAGEQRFFEACRDQLDSEYIVFYSVQWLALDKNGRPQDSEADFIVAHPSKGVLVIEVKGGKEIDFNPSTGKWTSLSHGGSLNIISDPVRQAVGSQHNLERALRPMLDFPTTDITIGHALSFPDIINSYNYNVRPDIPLDIILDGNSLANLPTSLNRLFAFYSASKPPLTSKAGKSLVNALRTLLGRAIEFRPAVWGQLVDESNEILRLTQEQFAVLDLLQFKRRALIWGCAGSGKTMIATEKAVRLARQGFSVLLTCFNKGLAAFLRTRIASLPDGPSLPLSIASFHDYCEELATRANLPLPPPPHKQSYYDEVLPFTLMQAADKLNIHFDALIVDEGQDFRDEWWSSLDSLLNDRDESILYIFYDEDQRIYPRTGQFPITDDPFPLTRNCRNTKTIHQQMLKFYTGGLRLSSAGPRGRPVQVLTYSAANGLHATLSSLLQKFIQEYRIPAQEIVILTPTRKNSSLWSRHLPGPISLSDQWPSPPNTVYSTTVHAFKGLEASVIILVEPHVWPTRQDDPDRAPIRSILYVATSRARNHLAILLPDDAPANILKDFPKT